MKELNKTKTAYLYDEKTKMFVKSVECPIDIEATKREGKEVYIHPKNSTFEPIKEPKEGFVRVWLTSIYYGFSSWGYRKINYKNTNI